MGEVNLHEQISAVVAAEVDKQLAEFKPLLKRLAVFVGEKRGPGRPAGSAPSGKKRGRPRKSPATAEQTPSGTPPEVTPTETTEATPSA